MSRVYMLESPLHGSQEFEIRSNKGYGYVYHNGSQIAYEGHTERGVRALVCSYKELESVCISWWIRNYKEDL